MAFGKRIKLFRTMRGFNGFLFCADCHNKLHFHGCDRLKNKFETTD